LLILFSSPFHSPTRRDDDEAMRIGIEEHVPANRVGASQTSFFQTKNATLS
jgi:hypothetical protein